MLHIILLILKIIGIVLLCILGLIILVLLSVLFVPVRYRIEIMREEGEDKPPVVVRAKVIWLLHLLNILICYPDQVLVRVRLAVFTLFKIPQKQSEQDTESENEQQKKKRLKKHKKASRKEKQAALEEKAGAPETEDKPAEENLRIEADETPMKEGLSGKTKAADKDKIPTVTIEASKKEKETENAQKKPSVVDKLRALPVILQKIIQKIKSLFENIQYTIQSICDKMKSISDNIQYYKEVVESDIFQRSFGLCKEELSIVLKSLKPQKLEAKWIVGMEDPAATGQILAVCGMLYPVFGGHVDVTGDFERKRIEGYVFIKGKIRVFTFLRVAVRIYFNKDVKRLIRLLKKEAV